MHPGRLKLEITESIFMTKDSATMACLDALTALGVGLSLDDFGTGYSSLSYVMSYPFTTLKIDRSFTSRLCQDDRGASVVKAICALASSLDMETVAEGVGQSRSSRCFGHWAARARKDIYSVSQNRPRRSWISSLRGTVQKKYLWSLRRS